MLRLGLSLNVLLAGQEEGSLLLKEAAMQLSPAQGVAGHHTSLPSAEVLAGQQAQDREGDRGRGGQRGGG